MLLKIDLNFTEKPNECLIDNQYQKQQKKGIYGYDSGTN